MKPEFSKDPNALTDNPQVFVCWRNYQAIFCAADEVVTNFNDRHLTNYEDVILRLHETQENNKAGARANSELIDKLRKKIKRAKRELK